MSNDNPYSESIFKTLKYRPNYQPKGFGSVTEARIWCRHFVEWYRFEHHHSGIKFVTPAQRHEVYEAAKASHPERWNGRQTRDWSDIGAVYLNPDKTYEETTVAIVKDPEVRAS